MAEKSGGKSRKRKRFEMEKSCRSPSQNASVSKQPSKVVSKAPRGINAAEFAESRAMEIHNMMQALSTASKQSNKRVFQSLPRHMRRRAASHNSRRMPVRLRDAYNREALKSREKQKEPKQKKSRRHRRKPSNLLEEYKRRQRKHAWLETHIWHAKRFKMVEQWGYKIPLHPNDKSIRASYRAMANGCLLQDISYYQCIEVHGSKEMIIAAMKHLTSPEIGLTMAAKEYLDGRHEGHTLLYKYDQYPYHAIGPVMFLWQRHLQDTSSPSAKTKLWVWSHPTCSDDILKEIVHTCSLEGPTENVDSKSWLSKETDPVTDNLVPASGIAPEFTVTVLHEQLVRLRLTGPKSHALLAATLELCDWGTQKDKTGSQWWQVYNKGEHKRKMLEEQNKSWEQMKGVVSPGVLKAGSVMALVVTDPRLGLPVTKSSVDTAAEDLYQDVSTAGWTMTSCPADSAVSPLWDCAVRKEVKQNKTPEKDLNNLRSKQPVPGSKLDLGDDTSRIPVLVIQQPGSIGNYQTGSIDFGCGYDVIFPAGWSMAFWIAFVYRGARVGGTREFATCSREQGVPHFPCDFPDTKAGREYNDEQKRSGEEAYKRYPPAKRPNYANFAVASPFAPDWSTLVCEWSSEVERVVVDMREVAPSANLKEVVVKDNQEITCLESPNEVAVKDTQSGHCLENPKLLVGDSQSGEIHCLEADSSEGGVYNGTLKDTRVHCEDPNMSNDIEACNEDQNGMVMDSSVLSGTKGDALLIENKTNIDTRTPNLQFNVIRTLSTRRRLQDITLSFKQTTKRRRPMKNNISNDGIIEFLTRTITPCSRSLVGLTLRPLSKGSPQDNAMIYIPTAQDLRDLKKDKNFGGPVELVHKCNNNVIGQCSRKAIGWVTSGEYSFVRAQGSAVGFCTFPGFCELLVTTMREKCSPLVLVRNTNTNQYRFANFIVV